MAVDGVMLHMLCGYIASGKSTLAAQLGSMPRTIVIDQDVWLIRLFGDYMKTTNDYLHFAVRLRSIWEGHIIALLQASISVVLDVPSYRPGTRRWMRGLAERGGAMHCVHFLDVPVEVCKARLAKRNSDQSHPFQVSDRQFDLVARGFIPPSPQEGLNVILHRPDRATAQLAPATRITNAQR